MGNLWGPEYKCPEHKDKSMLTVCLDPRCIEPLCDTCLERHRQKHANIGTPPDLKKTNEVYKAMTDSINYQVKTFNKMIDFSEPVRRLSTPETLRQFTRQYFLKKRSEVTKEKPLSINDFLTNLEMAERLKQPAAQESIRSFLKTYLKVNEEVVDEQFRPMYK